MAIVFEILAPKIVGMLKVFKFAKYCDISQVSLKNFVRYY